MKFKKFCRKLKYNKKIALSVVALFLVSLMSVGFAYMSQKLEVKATVNVYNKFSVRVVSVVVSEMTNGGVTQYNPNYNKLDVSTTSTLPNLDSTITYKISIKNYSMSVAAKLESIIEKSISNENVDYTLSIKEGDLINSNSTTDVYLTIKYKDTTTVLPSDINTGVELEFKFIENEDDLYGKYAEGNMLLNLRGVDEPVNNVWYDKENGYAMKLNNVDYDSEHSRYSFNGNGYGTIGKAIIPATGDFTLEARITFPDNISSVTDQSIVSQISGSSNDAGRFKFNAYTSSGTSVFRVFMNDTSNTSVNPMITFIEKPNLNQGYLLQAVRTGDELKLYLDGQYITNYALKSKSTISQGPFKLSRWNNSTKKPYTGNIYSVRVYNRALAVNELANNKTVDDNYYIEKIDPVIPSEPDDPKSKYLSTYAINNQSVTTGDGIHIDITEKYVYRGIDVNNYLKFSGDDDIYRIISYDITDGTMKILNTSTRINQPFDESGNRSFNTSTYCNGASKVADASINQMYGCNAWTNSDSFTNGTTTGNVLNNSSSNIYLNTTYYDSLPSVVKEKIISHDFNVGILASGISRDKVIEQAGILKWKGNVGMLTAADVFNSSVATSTVSNAQKTLKSYLFSLQGNKDIFWTMTAATNNTWDIYAMALGTSIGKRRASRYTQLSGSITYTMYMLPSFYVSSDVTFTGSGTSDDPFIIG